jgi:hypothetical protein
LRNLEELYDLYHLDRSSRSLLWDIIQGSLPPRSRFLTIDGRHLTLIYGIYRQIISANYPHETTIDGEELLKEGIRYFYHLVDHYGIQTDFLRATCDDGEVYQDLRSRLSPLAIKLDKTRTDDQAFIQFFYRQTAWFIDTATQLLPFSATIQNYVSFGYSKVNQLCRSRKSVVLTRSPYELEDQNQLTLNLLTAFTLASPLPEDLIVYRYSGALPADYFTPNGMAIEPGFMSVSVREIPFDQLNRTYYNHYFVLYVKKGTICLNTLLYNTVEYELIFPPGTRFKIFETKQTEFSVQREEEGMNPTVKVHLGLIC